jgi:tetratricopeptide (TPR) repeat protein
LLLARRPGQPVFSGVVCAGLALVASAPRLLLQPTLVSFLFLAALMALLIRVPRRPGSWLFPGLVAGLFWLWANCDQWFFVGPAVLLLYTVGQYVRADEEEHIPTLWKALGLGVVACMLNPHHVRVWTLPTELVGGPVGDAFRKDPEFAWMFRGAFDPGALDFAGDRDNPANLYALLALIALTLIGFAVNYRRASAGLALAWAGAVVLALLHVRAVPFLALVSAPVAAVNLAAAGRRLAETPLSDGAVRTLQALRAGGRGIVGLAGLLLIALTFPGWLHPQGYHARWKWDLDPDPSQVRAAERLREWRESGALPPDARLLNLQPGFASYAAWYAPGEKSFFDYRIGFHAPEAAEYAALRRHLTHQDPRARHDDQFNPREFLTRYGITFAVCAHPNRGTNQVVLTNLWADETDPMAGPDWTLWDVQGRAVTLGWSRQRVIPSAAFDRLRFDPLKVAYVEPGLLPAPPVRPPTLPGDIWERFLAPPPPEPVEVEQAIVLLRYRQALIDRAVTRHRGNLFALHLLAQNRLMTPAAPTWTAIQPDLAPLPIPPEVTAVSLLAVRAARQAIAASPDHPDGYFYLAYAYADDTFTTVADFREVVTTVNRARARARVPDDPTERRVGFDVLELCRALTVAHMQAAPQRLDLALDAFRLARAYLRQDSDDKEATLAGKTGEAREAAESELDRLRRQLTEVEKQITDLDALVKKNSDRYVVTASAQTSALDRAAVARRFGLIREATAELKKAHEQFQKQLEEQPNKTFESADLAGHLAVHAELIELLWYEGRVEEAQQILDTVDTPDVLRVMDSPAVRDAHFRVRQRAMSLMFPDPRFRPASRHDGNPAGHFRSLRLALDLVVGNFEHAAASQAQDAQGVRKALTEFKAKHFPDAIPDPATMPEPHVLQRELHTRPVLAPVMWARLMQWDHLRQMLDLSRAHADGQFRLGITNLEWGDVRQATAHFRQAQDAPGWTSPLPTQRMAREYLRALDRLPAGRGGGS